MKNFLSYYLNFLNSYYPCVLKRATRILIASALKSKLYTFTFILKTARTATSSSVIFYSCHLQQSITTFDCTHMFLQLLALMPQTYSLSILVCRLLPSCLQTNFCFKFRCKRKYFYFGFCIFFLHFQFLTFKLNIFRMRRAYWWCIKSSYSFLSFTSCYSQQITLHAEYDDAAALCCIMSFVV